MARVQTDGQKIEIKRKRRYPKLEFDKLQMYFGQPYTIDLENVNGSITIKMPTVGKVMIYGEKKFNETLSTFVTNTTSYRLALWDSGIDWNEISDFDLFCMIYNKIDPGAAALMFDLDFQKFELKKVNVDGEDKIVLYDAGDDIEINEDVYQYMHQYLQEVFNIFPDEKITHNETMKEMFIKKDRAEFERQKNKPDGGSSIQALISSCVNHPGFKYKLSELTELGIAEFYDSVKRLQVYESSTALMKGMYSGFVDSSKISADSYNFMKEF